MDNTPASITNTPSLETAFKHYMLNHEIVNLRPKCNEYINNAIHQNNHVLAQCNTFPQFMASTNSHSTIANLIVWLLQEYPYHDSTPLSKPAYRKYRPGHKASSYINLIDHFMCSASGCNHFTNPHCFRNRRCIDSLLLDKTPYAAYIKAFDKFCYQPARELAIEKLTHYNHHCAELTNHINTLVTQRDALHTHSQSYMGPHEQSILPIHKKYDTQCTICRKMRIIMKISNSDEEAKGIIKILYSTEPDADITDQPPQIQSLFAHNHIYEPITGNYFNPDLQYAFNKIVKIAQHYRFISS